MKVRYQADNDLKKPILQGVLRHEPAIDFRSAQSANLDSVRDVEVWRRAAVDGRILVSHDVSTMPRSFEEFIASGGGSPGLFLVPQGKRVSAVIETLVMVWLASEASEWDNRLVWLPF